MVFLLLFSSLPLGKRVFHQLEGISIPNLLKPLVHSQVKARLIEKQWPEIIRLIASIVTSRLVPSHLLPQLDSFPRQNELSIALREIGRIERSLFILKWVTDIELQKRAQFELNKGEAHHALKRALNFNRRGEIRDRNFQSQQDRMSSLNLLAAIIIYWNTKRIGNVVKMKNLQGNPVDKDILKHVSPLGWEHIILSGEYKWKMN